MAKKKKYSLKERINYFDSIIEKNFKTNEDYKKPKVQFAFGYLQAVERGAPGNLNDKTKSYQAGVQAGLKAKRKSLNVRF